MPDHTPDMQARHERDLTWLTTTVKTMLETSQHQQTTVASLGEQVQKVITSLAVVTEQLKGMLKAIEDNALHLETVKQAAREEVGLLRTDWLNRCDKCEPRLLALEQHRERSATIGRTALWVVPIAITLGAFLLDFLRDHLK